MKKTLEILFKGLVVIVIICWVSLVLIEYSRYTKSEPMMVVLSKKVLDYDDGHVYVYTGLGYKSIIYERTSIYGKEFGPIFIPVRDSVPKRG